MSIEDSLEVHDIFGVLNSPPPPPTARKSNLLVDSTCYVGIEVELEEIPYDEYAGNMLPNWRWKEDNSLRGEYPSEFVFDGPLYGENIVQALQQLEGYIISRGYKPYCSKRTSLHVHLDMRSATLKQLNNFILAYVLVEPLLYNYVGDDRESNIFSLPIGKASGDLVYLSKLFNSPINKSSIIYFSMIRKAVNLLSKYSGLNIRSLKTFGSVEIRLHSGEWKTRKILDWLNILLSLRQFAMEYAGDYESLLSKATDTFTFVEEIFKEYTAFIWCPLSKEMARNHKLAKDLVYGTRYSKASLHLLEHTYKKEGEVDLASKVKKSKVIKSTWKDPPNGGIPSPSGPIDMVEPIEIFIDEAEDEDEDEDEENYYD